MSTNRRRQIRPKEGFGGKGGEGRGTDELSIVRTGKDGMNDGKGEFSLGDILAETLVVGILRIL
jgi:hypothetical protein